jgi:hypothetical protein
MSAAARLQKNVSTTRTALVSYVLLARWAGSGDGFFIGACSAAVGGSTLTPCIPATVLAGTLGPLGRSSDEHLVGSGGLLWNDLMEVVGLRGGIVLEAFSVGVTDVTGLTGWERLCSGAWNVYTVRGGL